MIPVKRTCFAMLIILAAGRASHADMMSKPKADDKAPSRDQVLWTETDLGYDLEAEYSYVGSADVDFGHGRSGPVHEHVTDLRHVLTNRQLMSFLLHSGVQWQRVGFSPPEGVLLPNELDTVNIFLASDFRWSKKDMMRVQIQPGLYSDLNDLDMHDFNVPIAIAYTHINSERFQWALGLSINTWRGSRYLPGGGFRYYVNDRWKLKFMLPQPQIEYRAAEALHLNVGADFRGDTFRVSRQFGDRHSVKALNDALVNYQEIRVGTGFSWNIKPLIELNGTAGWMIERTFDFHNAGYHSSGRGAPFVALNLRALWQLKADRRPIPAQIRSMQYEFPGMQRFFKLPS